MKLALGPVSRLRTLFFQLLPNGSIIFSTLMGPINNKLPPSKFFLSYNFTQQPLSIASFFETCTGTITVIGTSTIISTSFFIGFEDGIFCCAQTLPVTTHILNAIAAAVRKLREFFIRVLIFV